MICTFFGHKDTPDDIYPVLEKTIAETIQKYPDIQFYVGHNGHFDGMARTALKKLSAPYTVVLAYLPGRNDEILYRGEDTLYPEGLETVPKRYAIPYRNKWLVNNSDMVIAYIRYTASRAAEFVKSAEHRGKPVINIADIVKVADLEKN